MSSPRRGTGLGAGWLPRAVRVLQKGIGMDAKKATACGILALVLAPVGCLDLEGPRPNTLPRRTTRPAPRRPTEVTAPPTAMSKATPPQNSPRPRVAPVPAAVASEMNADDFNSSPTRVTAPPKQIVSVGPNLVPPPPDDDSPPPLPSAAETARQKPPTNDDPSAPPPIPSVIKTTPTPAGDITAISQLRALYRKAAERDQSLDSYIVRLKRREQINGKDKPEELMLCKFRKKPYSVYFKWLGIQGHNREVIYVKGKHGDLIHSLLAEGDMPLMPAGKRMSLSPDNIFVRSASRHSITDAGLSVSVERFGKVLDAMEAGDARRGTMKYLGTLKRPEFDKPLDAAEQAIPSGYEPQLPKGGSRLWLFDPDSHLPVLLVTTDHTNHEVEYYCYDRIQYPVKLDDDDFNPDRVWKQR